jgi:hypothetical protein
MGVRRNLGLGLSLLALAGCGKSAVVHTATPAPAASSSKSSQLRSGALSVADLQAAEPSADTMRALGFAATAPNAADDAAADHAGSAALAEAYTTAGFLYRHTRDYVRVGFSPDRPSSWFPGTTALVRVTFDEFPSTAAADQGVTAAVADLTDAGHRPLTATGGRGVHASQLHKPGDVVSTAVVQRDATTVVSVTGACNGCADGALPSDFQPVVDTVKAAVDHVLATPPSDVDRITAFLAAFSQQFRAGDVEALVAELNPVVITRYGRPQCQAHVTDIRAPVLKDPTVSLTLKSVTSGPAPYDWVTDNETTTVPNTYTLAVDIVEAGAHHDETIHLNVVDGAVTWFLDCGTPKPIGG